MRTHTSNKGDSTNRYFQLNASRSENYSHGGYSQRIMNISDFLKQDILKLATSSIACNMLW